MDTIRIYLENIFKTLPQTPQVLLVKGQLADDMETKYQDLLEGGANESEAVAKVIGDFGSMDELLDELEIMPAGADEAEDAIDEQPPIDPALPEVTFDEAEQFLSRTRKSAWFVNLGVALMAIGALLIYHWAQLVLLMQGPLELVFFSVLVVLAAATAGLFMYARKAFKDFAFIEKGIFSMKPVLTDQLRSKFEAKSSSLRISSIIAAFLYLMGVVTLLFIATISPNWLWASSCIRALLLLTVVGALVFIPLMMTLHAYRQLLKRSSGIPADATSSYVIGAVASIVWPAALVVYLNWAVQMNAWRIAWILWPLVGGLFAAFVILFPYMHSQNNG